VAVGAVVDVTTHKIGPYSLGACAQCGRDWLDIPEPIRATMGGVADCAPDQVDAPALDQADPETVGGRRQ
jgi:hypothetical protein